MRISILHETRYEYSSDVEQAHHVAMLQPAALSKQQLLSHELRIEPPPEVLRTSTDENGFPRAYFEIAAPHRSLCVTAKSEVVTAPQLTSQAGKLDRVGVPVSESWESVAAAMRYQAATAAGGAFSFDAAQSYLHGSPLAPIDSAFLNYVSPLASPSLPVFKLASELAQRIFSDFKYSPHATSVDTSPLEALAAKHGVCQDYAQVMIACFRSLGLPAKYVSGYLLTHPPRGQPRLIGADASHAWVSVYCPKNGWLEFDPTNNCLAGEGHIVVAYGRDYSDVPPLRGVIRGGGAHELRVAVTVMPM